MKKRKCHTCEDLPFDAIVYVVEHRIREVEYALKILKRTIPMLKCKQWQWEEMEKQTNNDKTKKD